MQGISWLAENHLASQEGLCYREEVSIYHVNVEEGALEKNAIICVTPGS
jgi:hypothetical protein